MASKLNTLLDALDNAAAVNEDHEEGVAFCYACGDQNASTYVACCGCGEAPLGGNEAGVPEEEEQAAGSFAKGDEVYALFYVDSLWYNARVEDVFADGSYNVLFTEYGNFQETRPQDVMLEELALMLAAQLASPPPEHEDPDARAARILRELTPYGDCRNCGGTIMESDDKVCLVCGGSRWEPGEERIKPGAAATAHPVAGEQMSSPRKTTGFADKLRSVVHKDDKKEKKKDDGEKKRKEEKEERKREEEKKKEEKKEKKLAERLAKKEDDAVVEEPPTSPKVEAKEEEKEKGEKKKDKKLFDRFRKKDDDSAPPEESPVSPRGEAVKERDATAVEKEEKKKDKTLMDRLRGSVAKKDDGSRTAAAVDAPVTEEDASKKGKETSLFEKLRFTKKEDESKSPAVASSSKRFSHADRSSASADAVSPRARASMAERLKTSTIGLKLKPRANGPPPAARAPPKDKNKKQQTGAQKVGTKQVVQQEPAVTKITIAKGPELPAPVAAPVAVPPSTAASGSGSAAPAIPPKPSRAALKASAGGKAKENAVEVPAPVQLRPVPPKLCNVCKLAIRKGDPVVGDAQIHASCWNCSICKDPLKKFFLVEGKMQVCERCNSESKLKCCVCETPVKEYYRVGKKIYCPDHFERQQTRCDVCQKGLTQYYSHEGKILCEEDYRNIAMRKCGVCRCVLESYYDYNNMSLCEKDYHAERLKGASKCSVCKEPVLSYHKIDGIIYCEKDRPRCVTCRCVLEQFVEREGVGRLCVPCSKKPVAAAASPKMAVTEKKPDLVARKSDKGAKFCAGCGQARNGGAKFCANCGHKHTSK